MRISVVTGMVASMLVAAIAIGFLGQDLMGAGRADKADALPSEYAPAADLRAQLEDYLQRLSNDLADEGRYKEEQQDRVAKDANTVAVLALVLGLHDEPTPEQRAAPSILAAAEKLAAATGDYAAARTALDALKQAMHQPSDTPLEWTPVGDVAQLMKQVPIVNNNLRRAVTSRRFEREIDKAAGLAATLAAIAQATRVNTDYCSDADDEKRWAAISRAMRDAAADVARAARAGDQKTATDGLGRLVKTCDECHAEFR